MSDQITIPKPRITTGPEDMTDDEAAAMYLREAARRVRKQRYWGSGVTTLVSRLLDDAAEAIDAEVTA